MVVIVVLSHGCHFGTSHGVTMHDFTVNPSLVAKLLCCSVCCLLHTQVKRIQSVPLVIGQFLEAIDQNYAIVGSTTGWVWPGGCGWVGVGMHMSICYVMTI